MTNNRKESFVIPANVGVFGGFRGDESRRNERPRNLVTIFDGNIGAIGDITDNTCHIVIINARATLMSVVIQNGYCGTNDQGM